MTGAQARGALGQRAGTLAFCHPAPLCITSKSPGAMGSKGGVFHVRYGALSGAGIAGATAAAVASPNSPRRDIFMQKDYPMLSESAIEKGLRRGANGPLVRRWVEATRKGASVAAALLLTACAPTPRPVLTQVFPPSPVDLKSPLPVMTTLPEKASLSDIMRAHLADAEAFQQITAELKTWRAWYSAQSTAWSRK